MVLRIKKGISVSWLFENTYKFFLNFQISNIWMTSNIEWETIHKRSSLDENLSIRQYNLDKNPKFLKQKKILLK